MRDAYARHSTRWQEDQYRSWTAGNLFMLQERERVVLDMLRRRRFFPLADKRILDAGCAAGKSLMAFLRYGAQPKNLFGVDLLEAEIEKARELAPHLTFQVADARRLPFEDGAFDLVIAFTLFSSIRDQAVRREVAQELLRLLSPSGVLIAYDFRIRSHVNRDTEPVRLNDLSGLFRGCRIDVRRLTLAPPVARAVAPRSWVACEILARVPFLRTHWLAIVSRGSA